MKIKRKKKADCKPNIIPILDAVFIFIFFLLMSAQFLEIYEIGTDAPSVQTVSDEKKDKKEPLNLTVIITAKGLEVKTGLDLKTYKTIALQNNDYNYEELKQVLIKVKKENIDEESIVLKPSKTVSYKKVVWIMDTVRGVSKDQPSIVGIDKQGKKIETRTLFNQIIFETVI